MTTSPSVSAFATSAQVLNPCICWGLGQSPSSAAEAAPQMKAAANRAAKDRIVSSVLYRQPSKRAVAFDLRAMHQPPVAGVELIATMQNTAIVPQHEVADPPLLIPGQLETRSMRPQRVEEPLAFFELQTVDVGVAPT